MNFRTQVELPKEETEIRHSDRIMLFGSCFAENIGNLLLANKFRCDVNPFGILYNPLSVAEAIRQTLSYKTYNEADLFCDRAGWHSFMHHGSFSGNSAEECLLRINERLGRAAAELPQTDWLMITWGTAWVYSLKENGKVVGNCHKQPDKLFTRRLLSVEEIVVEYFDTLQHHYPMCHYFPSYEIMMDELRDYRFYADDMFHPSPMAVSYIWKCFGDTYFSSQTRQIMKEWEEIRKGLNHKPFDVRSEAYRSFLTQIVLKISRMKEKFPYFELQKELEQCQAQLKI